jgi:hypothetical protein
MPLGPVEMLVVKFPGNQVTGDIVPALAALVETGAIRIIDLLFVTRDEHGVVRVREHSDLARDIDERLAPLVPDMEPMLSEDDACQLVQSLENNTSAGLLLFENTWGKRFADAIRNANGEVVLNERIPHAIVAELLAAPA